MDPPPHQEDAKFQFQIDEAQSRRDYSGALATAEKTRALGVSAITHSSTLTSAGLQEAVDAAFANAEEIYWTAETGAANNERMATAQADVDFWSAQESAHVTAADQIDDELGSDWSAFIEARAGAHANWWTGIADDYLQMIASRNAVETGWQTVINNSHANRELVIRTEKKAESIAQANAERAKDEAFANIRFSQIIGLLDPAYEYLETTATAHRDRLVEQEQAARDYVEHEDAELYFDEWLAAQQRHDTATQSARQIYQAHYGAGLAVRLSVEAGAKATQETSVALAAKNRRVIEADAVRDHEVVDSQAYAALTAAIAAIDEAYWIFEAAGLESMAQGVASSSNTPWATHAASSQGASAEAAASVAAAKRARRVAESQAQAQVEIQVSNEEYGLQSAAATADYNRTVAVTTGEFFSAANQVISLVTQGSSGQLATNYPALSDMASTSDYAISTEGTASYYVWADYSWGFGWPYSYFSHWNYSGIGYGVFALYGSYYDAYFGFNYYGGYTYYNYGYNLFGLFGWGAPQPADPSEQSLGNGFWDLAGEITDISTPADSRTKQLAAVPRAMEMVAAEELQTTIDSINASIQQSQSGATEDNVDTEARSIHTHSDVARMIGNMDSKIGSFFGAHVRMTHTVVPERDLGDTPASSGTSLFSPLLSASEMHFTEFQAKADLTTWGQIPHHTTSQRVANRIVEQVNTPQQLPAENLAGLPGHRAVSLGQQKYIKHLSNRTVVDNSRGSNQETKLIRFIWQPAGTVGPGVLLGQKDVETGWLYISEDLGGGRATLRAVDRAFGGTLGSFLRYRIAIGDTSLRAIALDRINGIKSPFEIQDESTNVLIAIDGTGNHIESQDNVARVYNAFKGTKLYYGGVGNPIEWWTAKGGPARGWNEILDRVAIDLRFLDLSGKNIFVVGFSRGAAMAVELTRRHSSITFQHVGLFDPVYSVGLPGQQSRYVYQTWKGWNSNFVTTSIPSNVRSATAIYAAHEERSWFPATLFDTTDSTRFDTWLSPGQHGEVGGHWQNNWRVGEMTLSLMADRMMQEGSKLDLRFDHHSEEIRAALSSEYLRELTRKANEEYFTLWREPRWTQRGQERYWGIDTVAQMEQFLRSNSVPLDWAPWGLGVQSSADGVEWADLSLLPPITLPTIIFAGTPAFSNHFPRILSERKINIYFAYDYRNFEPDRSVARVFNELFALLPNPDGKIGWQGFKVIVSQDVMDLDGFH